MCLSSICCSLASRAHLNIQGKAKRLFTWFGKSLLQVATINAPHFFASSGIISGIGFDKAKTIGFSAISFMSSAVIKFGFETHINTSAHLKASCIFHFIFSILYCATSSLYLFRFSLHG